MSEPRKVFSSTIVFFIAAAAVVISLWGMQQAAQTINALILGAIIVASFTPLMHWLQRKGVPGLVAYVITLVAIFAVFAGLLGFLVVATNRFIQAIPDYAAELQSVIQSFQEYIVSLGIENIDFLAITDLFDPAKLLDIVAGFLGGLIGAFSNVFLIGLIIIFLLVDAMSLPKKLMPHIERGNNTVNRFYHFGKDVRQYVIITTIVGLVTGVLDTMLFLVMGVDFAVLWGILAFLLSYIPTLGFWIALIPPTFLALLESGPLAALIVFLGIVILNGFAENVVKPKYMGEGLDLSPFVVVFSVVFWAGILGALGAILAVPITMAFKVLILEPDPTTRWMADVMGAGNKKAAEEVEAGESAAEAQDKGPPES
jgi:predicted PurR-regulated permease PerM